MNRRANSNAPPVRWNRYPQVECVVSRRTRAGAAQRVRLSRVGRSLQGGVERTRDGRVAVLDREWSELRELLCK